MTTRQASARYEGLGKQGKGHISSQSGVLDNVPYGFGTRFGDEKGTNPEELIAAAHASCCSMMLSKIVGYGWKTAMQISTSATLTMRVDTAGVKITSIHLVTEAQVSGIDAAGFQKAANEAKEKCPVSGLLKPGLESLTLAAKLKS